MKCVWDAYFLDKVKPIDSLNHATVVQFDVIKNKNPELDSPLRLPEKYNGLGYQNLISMVFMLIRFRDEWISWEAKKSRVAKSG